MYCWECGERLDWDDVYCPECGTPTGEDGDACYDEDFDEFSHTNEDY